MACCLERAVASARGVDTGCAVPIHRASQAVPYNVAYVACQFDVRENRWYPLLGSERDVLVCYVTSFGSDKVRIPIGLRTRAGVRYSIYIIHCRSIIPTH